MTRLPRLCALFALLATLAGTARAACTVEALATVPLELSGGHILITVTINDTDAAVLFLFTRLHPLMVLAASAALGALGVLT